MLKLWQLWEKKQNKQKTRVRVTRILSKWPSWYWTVTTVSVPQLPGHRWGMRTAVFFTAAYWTVLGPGDGIADARSRFL